MLQFLWCYLVLVVVIADGNKLYKTIETHNGLIRGIPSKTLLKNIDYFAFRGIPYAEAPIGELRFKVIIFSFKLFLLSSINENYTIYIYAPVMLLVHTKFAINFLFFLKVNTTVLTIF